MSTCAHRLTDCRYMPIFAQMLVDVRRVPVCAQIMRCAIMRAHPTHQLTYQRPKSSCALVNAPVWHDQNRSVYTNCDQKVISAYCKFRKDVRTFSCFEKTLFIFKYKCVSSLFQHWFVKDAAVGDVPGQRRLAIHCLQYSLFVRCELLPNLFGVGAGKLEGTDAMSVFAKMST